MQTTGQQINPGWLGPPACQGYSARWVQEFSVPTDLKYSQFLMHSVESLDSDVLAEIQCALRIVPKKRGKPAVDLLKLPTTVPSFREDAGRIKVASVLRAFACWKPDVGYQPELALLAAHIMAVAGNERVTFQALATTYRKYHLQDYFEGADTQEAIVGDAEKIWAAARLYFPDLAHAFSRFGKKKLFLSVVSSLLSKLLTQTYRPDLQPFEHHVRLLHNFLLPVGDYDPEDPRAQLRRLVLVIMARHEESFLQSSEAEIKDVIRDVVPRVDSVLIEMLNANHPMPDIPSGPLWPSLLLTGLGAVLAYDMASPWGMAAQVTWTTGAAVSGFVYGALQSAQVSVEAAVLANRAFMLQGDKAEVSEDESD
ncbi:unnamed protein product [Symbiodinium natans]|uniref:Rab-GAP TBC domain-containing protein n=1 Tax=Symbiodinium natans TaxID=878477 RepID=A0A812TSA4_9DINO|nr:unnamed protein product [Symbiodinium natans]